MTLAQLAWYKSMRATWGGCGEESKILSSVIDGIVEGRDHRRRLWYCFGPGWPASRLLVVMVYEWRALIKLHWWRGRSEHENSIQ